METFKDTLAAVVAALAVFTVCLLIPVHAAAASVAASSHTALWWDGQTCRAFAAGHVHAMVVDSRHADTYLRVDVALWAHDAKYHAGVQTLEADRSYVAMDCTFTGDEG